MSHSFGTNKVLENVDLVVKDSTVLGLVGINGAGKSTLLRLISGVYRPQSGRIEYDGKDPIKGVTRQDIFLLPDDPYYSGQTSCKSLFKMYKVFYPNIDENVYKEIIKDFNLNEKKPLRTFSKGMRRQAFVALAFAVAPKYLLLDEAFDGLDPLARKKFKEFADESRKTAEDNGWEIGSDSDDFFEAYPDGSWGTSHETVELSETTFSEAIWCHD